MTRTSCVPVVLQGSAVQITSYPKAKEDSKIRVFAVIFRTTCFELLLDTTGRKHPLKQVPAKAGKKGRLRLKLKKQHRKALEKYYMDICAVENDPTISRRVYGTELCLGEKQKPSVHTIPRHETITTMETRYFSSKL